MKNTRLLALLLVFVMLFAVVGCEKSSSDGEATPTGKVKNTPVADLLSTKTPAPNKMKPVTADKVDTDENAVYTDVVSGAKSDFNDAESIAEAHVHTGRLNLCFVHRLDAKCALLQHSDYGFIR